MGESAWFGGCIVAYAGCKFFLEADSTGFGCVRGK